VPLRDVQDFAGHSDPKKTRRYARHSLDRNATYAVAAYLAAGRHAIRRPLPQQVGRLLGGRAGPQVDL